MSGLFVSQPPFLFQVWPDVEWNQDSADRPGELLRPLTRSCSLLLVLGRLFLLFLLGICLRSRWSPPFPLHALALNPLTLVKVRLLPTLTFSPSWSGVLDRRLCFFWFWQERFLRSQVFSKLKFFRWSLCHFARSLLVSGAPTTFPFLFSFPLVWLSFCPCHSVLSSIFPLISNSVVDLAGTVFSFLLFY